MNLLIGLPKCPSSGFHPNLAQILTEFPEHLSKENVKRSAFPSAAEAASLSWTFAPDVPACRPHADMRVRRLWGRHTVQYKRACLWEVEGGSSSPNRSLIAAALLLLYLQSKLEASCREIFLFSEAGRLAANQAVAGVIPGVVSGWWGWWLGKFPVLSV